MLAKELDRYCQLMNRYRRFRMNKGDRAALKRRKATRDWSRSRVG